MTDPHHSIPPDPALPALRKWAVLLDSAFQVPGTNMRFGLDPIVGLVPGAGDLVTGFFFVMILLHAIRLRVPKVIIGRMLLNAGADVLLGAVPLLGDLFDAGFKANLKNMALLEQYAQAGARPGRWDYALVAGVCALLAALAVLPLLLLWWILAGVARY